MNDVRQNIHSEVGKFVHNYKSLTVHAGDGEDVIVVANAMRDCVTGFIHWIYEGERYFGKRYEEVAKFGWVFTDTGAHEVGTSQHPCWMITENTSHRYRLSPICNEDAPGSRYGL